MVVKNAEVWYDCGGCKRRSLIKEKRWLLDTNDSDFCRRSPVTVTSNSWSSQFQTVTVRCFPEHPQQISTFSKEELMKILSIFSTQQMAGKSQDQYSSSIPNMLFGTAKNRPLSSFETRVSSLCELITVSRGMP